MVFKLKKVDLFLFGFLPTSHAFEVWIWIFFPFFWKRIVPCNGKILPLGYSTVTQFVLWKKKSPSEIWYQIFQNYLLWEKRVLPSWCVACRNAHPALREISRRLIPGLPQSDARESWTTCAVHLLPHVSPCLESGGEAKRASPSVQNEVLMEQRTAKCNSPPHLHPVVEIRAL